MRGYNLKERKVITHDRNITSNFTKNVVCFLPCGLVHVSSVHFPFYSTEERCRRARSRKHLFSVKSKVISQLCAVTFPFDWCQRISASHFKILHHLKSLLAISFYSLAFYLRLKALYVKVK